MLRKLENYEFMNRVYVGIGVNKRTIEVVSSHEKLLGTQKIQRLLMV